MMPGNVLHRVWPFEPVCPKLRTREDILRAVKEVDRSNKPCQGIKGASIMLLHKPFDIVKGFVVDYMHAVLLGVVPSFLNLWLSKENKQQPYYIGNKLAILNKRLMGIKAPDCISRLPRKLDERQHWKANEFRAWLLHYSIPVLRGILPAVYLNHFSLLVWAIYTLLGDTISSEDLEKAQRALDDFASSIPAMYSVKSMTMKEHQLRHVALCVKSFGPLWAFSCFAFENANGYVKGFVHGTRYISSQICFTLSMLRHRSEIVKRIERESISTEIMAFLRKLAGENQRTTTTTYGKGIRILGAMNNKPIADNHRMAVNMFLACRGSERVTESEHVATFFRIEKDGDVYHSKSYTRVSARNTYTIQFVNQGVRDSVSYGQVQLYLQTGRHCVAVVEQLSETPVPVLTTPPASHQPGLEVREMLEGHLHGELGGQLPMAVKSILQWKKPICPPSRARRL